MKQKEVLYQIKAFDKQLFRYFIKNTKDSACLFSHAPTPTQMQILEYIILHKKEEIFQKDLEKILGLRRATVSGVLKTMEKNNLIERITGEDARRKKIKMKDSAIYFFEENMKKVEELEVLICNGIEETELKKFCNILKQMQRNLQELEEKQVALNKKGVDDL